VAVLVGLPAGTGAPAPGALPASAHLTTLDRRAGIAEAFVPRSQLAHTLWRLRHAPGTRYAFVDRSEKAPGGLAGGCAVTAAGNGTPNQQWRNQIHVPGTSSPNGWTVGMVDSGADLSRLGQLDSAELRSFVGRQQAGSNDPAGHGTEVASIIAANRTDLTPSVLGVAPGVGLRVAQVTSCHAAPTTAALVRGLNWLDTPDVQVINVSLTVQANRALVDALHTLLQDGKLVVAAAGNQGAEPGPATFPASEPHVLAVGALSSLTAAETWSNRASWVDLVAPDRRLPVVQSSSVSSDTESTTAPPGTSFAAPAVAGAAVLVWAKHPGWSADEVATALTSSATPLGHPSPNSTYGYGRLNVAAAMRARPQADAREPNDWPSAAYAHPHPFLVRGPGTTGGLTATVGGRMDPVDLYPVSLHAGERLHVTAMSTRPVHISVAGTTAHAWTFRAHHAGHYLIRVTAPSPVVYTLTARG
jgi:hypothetical protein